MYALNKPFKSFRSKKGALELSINAIVVLILAITMLSLGLAFMKGLFKKTTGQLEKVGEDIKNQMIEQLRASSAKLTLNQEDITIRRGEKQDIYFAVKNILPAEQDFSIATECPDKIGSETLEAEIEVFLKTRKLKQNDLDVQKMIIGIPSTVTGTGTLSWALKVGEGYADKSFFVTVE